MSHVGNKWCLAALCLAGSLVAGCGDPGGDEAQSCAGDTDVLAVNQNGENVGLTEVVITSGGDEPELVTGDWVATKPSFGPDGEQLVVVRADGDYESAGPESTSLWIIGTDGSGPRQLTDGSPTTSPTGHPMAR